MTIINFLRVILYSLLLLLVITFVTPLQKTRIPTEVVPFYNRFITVVNQYCDRHEYFLPNFSIEIKELESPIIGLCISLPNKFTIYLDKKFWQEENDIDKFTLVAHELTHCMFDQDHVDNPKHYMASSFYYLTLEQLYSQMSDLFKEKCNAR